MCYCQKCRCKHKPCYRPEKPEWEKECPEYKPEKPCGHKPCQKYCDSIVVRDETVYCTEEVTYHHCVKHIVPVVCKKIENHVYHHEYEVQTCHEKEERCCEVGKRKEDWCKYCKCHGCKCHEKEYEAEGYDY